MTNARTCSITSGTAIVLAVLCLEGCRQVLGLSEYSKAPVTVDADNPGVDAGNAGAQNDASDGVPMFEPKLPFLTGAQCEACMDANCPGRTQECEAEPTCAAWLADARTNVDPAAVLRRWTTRIPGAAASQADNSWMAEHDDVHLYKEWGRAVYCTRDYCSRECDLGREFSCTGRFDYPPSYPKQVHVRFHVTDAVNENIALSHARIRACSPQDGLCNPELGGGTTDEHGYAEFDVMIPSLSAPFSDFSGYFLIDGVPTHPPFASLSSAPQPDGWFYSHSYVGTDLIDSWFGVFGKQRDLAAGLLYVSPVDCRGDAAKGVSLTVWIADGESYRRCDGECGFMYQDDLGVPDSTKTELSGKGHLVFVYNVPARRVVLVVRDVQSGDVVGVEQVSVRPGYVHGITVFPASVAQLSDLPKEAR